ncbi:hypothetical protein [Candidatus Rhabdochlamydia sp. W815]|nr:hypothetical protein [Candidatus Rhabdochlamydia sp. W815]
MSTLAKASSLIWFNIRKETPVARQLFNTLNLVGTKLDKRVGGCKKGSGVSGKKYLKAIACVSYVRQYKK